MRTLLLTICAVVLLPNPVQAGKNQNCTPQPVCRTAPETVQCRTILPYHVALQRADVADQLEVQTREQQTEIEKLKAELLAVRQDRDAIQKQAKLEKDRADQALVQLKRALAESNEAQKVAEAERVKSLTALENKSKALDQTQQALAKAEAALFNEQQNFEKMKEDRDVALQQVEDLKVALADLKAKIDQSERETPQKAPKPGDTPPAKTEEPVKIEDEADTGNPDESRE